MVKPAASGARAVPGARQRTQAARIHEREIAQVDHDRISPALKGGQLALEDWSGEQIQIAAHDDSDEPLAEVA
jgi:hypothetical protein